MSKKSYTLLEFLVSLEKQIKEIQEKLENLDLGEVIKIDLINDEITVADKTWSSNKIKNEITNINNNVNNINSNVNNLTKFEKVYEFVKEPNVKGFTDNCFKVDKNYLVVTEEGSVLKRNVHYFITDKFISIPNNAFIKGTVYKF